MGTCCPDRSTVITDAPGGLDVVVAGVVSSSEGFGEKDISGLFDKASVDVAPLEAAREEAVASEMDMSGALSVVRETEAGIYEGRLILERCTSASYTSSQSMIKQERNMVLLCPPRFSAASVCQGQGNFITMTNCRRLYEHTIEVGQVSDGRFS
jgi:hypothetical protein